MNPDLTDAEGNVPDWLPTVIVLGALAYVVIGVFWMDAHGTGPQTTLDANSVIGFLAAVFLWPLDLIGLI